MKKLPSTDLVCNEKLSTFARAMATVESRSRYRNWRALEAFQDRTPAEVEYLRSLPPHAQLRYGRRRRVASWIAAS